SGYKTTETFVEELKKHLKILQVCDTDPSGCFAPAITNSDSSETLAETKDLKNSSDLGRNWGTKALGIGLINGYTAILSYNPDCPVLDIGAPGAQTTSCLSLIYDINGKAKPNKLNKDIYTLNTNLCIKAGSLCVSPSNVTYSPIDTCDDPEYDPECTSAKSCRADFCGNNYWAGAMKACKEIGMVLPTPPELNSLLPYAHKLNMSGYYWASGYHTYTTAGMSHIGWQNFPNGGGGNATHKNNSNMFVRCVK
ncbi:MAG: hypothetical protein LBK53_08480, partial [Heliobacteriaceae bacterium]|nr:hypothetical protein [Heliobacteriaceae bacterium]